MLQIIIKKLRQIVVTKAIKSWLRKANQISLNTSAHYTICQILFKNQNLKRMEPKSLERFSITM